MRAQSVMFVFRRRMRGSKRKMVTRAARKAATTKVKNAGTGQTGKKDKETKKEICECHHIRLSVALSTQ